MAVKNMADSVRARLQSQAKEEGIPFQLALQLFAQEEFLRKLAQSEYKKNLVLKGGMFLYTLTNFDSRTTRDIDFSVHALPCDPEHMQGVMEEICRTDTGNDFITITVLSVEQTQPNRAYRGVRITFRAFIQRTRIPFSVDVGVGDVIVPGPVKRKITVRLPDFEQPEIYTYSLESTAAEKLHAILERMAATSRMKDFYDIYYLSEMFNFSGKTLCDAVSATLQNRNQVIDERTFSEIAAFADNKILQVRWAAFEPAKEAGLEFTEVLRRINLFLKPVCDAVRSNTVFKRNWDCHAQKWK